MQFISNVLNTIRSWIGLVLPVFSKAGDFRRWNPWVWRVLHTLSVIAVLVLLWWLNKVFEVGYWLQLVPEAYRQFYLPAAGLLVYALLLLVYWFWRLMGEDEGEAEFPDIVAAWDEAVRKLEAAGIGLADAPLFLVLGRPEAGEDALFQAGQVGTNVRAPAGESAPLRVYAHRDAIFVTCAGASAWGRFAAMLAGDVGDAGAAPAAPAIDRTIQFGAQMGIPQEQVDEMRNLLTVREQRPLTPEEEARLRELADMAKGPAAAKRRVALGAEEQTRGTARLSFLCRLVRRDRRPWCPVNGVLVLVPWSATGSDDAAREAGTVVQRELAAARAALQLRYPVFALVSDLETARGFTEFRSSFPPEMLKSRIGQRVPLVPDMAPSEVPGLVERAALWIGQSVLPMGIVKFLRLEAAAGPAATDRHNRNLYLLLREVYTRGPRLARVLGRGMSVTEPAADPLDALPLFGGCYLGGTGKRAEEQAFVPGVYQRLMDGQSSVSWTGEALAEDARYRRRAAAGYVATAIVAVAGVLAGGWWWHSRGA
jgi:hypothetical protein